MFLLRLALASLVLAVACVPDAAGVPAAVGVPAVSCDSNVSSVPADAGVHTVAYFLLVVLKNLKSVLDY